MKVGGKTDFTVLVPKMTDEKERYQIEKTNKDFVFAIKRSVMGDDKYRGGKGTQIILQSMGDKLKKLIKIARKTTCTQKESIKTGDPGAKFYVQENFKTICEGTAGTRQ